MSDTIAAIATAVGAGAVSMVRLSGPDALGICDRVFRGRARPSQSVHKSVLLGEMAAADGGIIDQVMMLVMRSPRSYTGEDVVEITCHGGLAAPRLVLRRLIEEGARPADPGEFTRRAFLNGKMDLAQAEAVCELVQARSEKALRVAASQLKGDLSLRISEAEARLTGHLALIEANIDFPEDEVEAVDRTGLAARLGGIGRDLEALLATRARGKLIKDGIDAAIVGRPNVGKSSLFNRLVGADRVMVSDVPGTTRDVVDASVAVDGLVVNLHDTAGVLEAVDGIERAAVERTWKAVEESDLVLVVLDAAAPMDTVDEALLEQAAGRRRLAVFNKVDLGDAGGHVPECLEVRVSALAGLGIEDLRARIRRIAEDLAGDVAGEILINERHAMCLEEAVEALERGRLALLDDLPLELAASDVRAALAALGGVTGSRATENLLDEIFSRFCIGK